MNGEHQILIATDRFSKWPTVNFCKLSETKKVLNFLKKKFNLYGIPGKKLIRTKAEHSFQRI